jgi:hypothetical protein
MIMIFMKKLLNILITNILIALCFICLVACESPVLVVDEYEYIPHRYIYSYPVVPRYIYPQPIPLRVVRPLPQSRPIPNRPTPPRLKR